MLKLPSFEPLRQNGFYPRIVPESSMNKLPHLPRNEPQVEESGGIQIDENLLQNVSVDFTILKQKLQYVRLLHLYLN